MHLGVAIDVLYNEDLRHLKNDEQLHGHKLVEEKVEGEEGREGLLAGTGTALEDVTHLFVVFLHEATCLRSEYASNDEYEQDVKGH